MHKLLLAGDVGGTKTNLALYPAHGELSSVFEKTYRNSEFDSMESLLWQFQQDSGLKADAACLAVAGAVRDGRCDMPNLGWHIDSQSLANTFGYSVVRLLNDLEATAYGIDTLTAEQLVVINAGEPDPAGNMALIAAGTGLGEAMMIRTANAIHIAASEGGHADFAPNDESQITLLRYLRASQQHVSWERVVSGPGLKNIYDALKDVMGLQEPDWLRERFRETNDPAATISESALNESSEICMRALEIFMAAYAAEAGNLALKALATGGVFIGGGIAPKLLPLFEKQSTFMAAFLNKGRFTELLAKVPVKVIMEPKTALRGAAAYLIANAAAT